MNNSSKSHDSETHEIDHSEHQSEDHSDHKDHEGMVQDFKRRFIIVGLISIPIVIFSPTIQGLFNYELTFNGVEYLLLVLSTITYIYGGIPFFKGLFDELKNSKPGMMTLVSLAISVSFIYSSAVVLFLEVGKFFFWELATLLVVMLAGHWIEMRSVMGASQALQELAKLIPNQAHLIKDDDTIVDIETDNLQAGNRVLVKPGETIPSDGKIIKGKTSVNESMITGESKPVSKSKGDEVIGGSVNGEGSIRVEIEKIHDETYLSQVMRLVEEAQKTRSRAQDLANRAAFYLTIIAIVGGILTLSIWLLLGEEFLFALERMVTVMVITCPHALGLAVPLVVSVSTSLSAKNGVLIRDRASFERARNVNKIVFDKTGTLTKGEFGVTDIVNLNDMDQNSILQTAASLEAESEHSIAKGIVNYAKEKETTFLELDDFKAIPGKGIQGQIKGVNYKVVSPGYLAEHDIEYDDSKINNLHEQGKTVVFLIRDKSVNGAIALADIIREESRQTIKELREMGISSIMLTGDNKQVAAYVSEELGIEEYYAEVLPDQKAKTIKKIQEGGAIVAMVGDGINDAPALVQADVGLAIGAGTNVAIESADIILVKDNPQNTIDAIKLARTTYGKMKQNLMWATGYNAIAIPLAAGILFNLGVILSPAFGAALMSLSTVIVAINSRFLSL